jgi:hypothetical protein
MGLIFFLSLFKVGDENIIVDTFDMIEINHHHNEWGVETWAQVILWDWHPAGSKFHCEKWIMMKGAHKKTKEGRKNWEKLRREIEQGLDTLERRKQWLNASNYMGDFSTDSKFYPRKNWTTGYYEIKYNDKNIRRIKDRKFHSTATRRGLSKQARLDIENIVDRAINFPLSKINNE